MKRPECKVKSCTDEKPTGSCRVYHEGYVAGVHAASGRINQDGWFSGEVDKELLKALAKRK